MIVQENYCEEGMASVAWQNHWRCGHQCMPYISTSHWIRRWLSETVAIVFSSQQVYDRNIHTGSWLYLGWVPFFHPALLVQNVYQLGM